MRRSKVFAKLCYVIALLCIGVVSQGYAQQSQSDLPGLTLLVTDSQQRVMAGAVCSLRIAGEKTRDAATATTDEQGVATFSGLPSGTYELRVEMPGFEPFTSRAVIIKNGATTTMELSLAVAAQQESVTIAAPAEEGTAAAAGSSIPSGTLHRQALQRLPLAAAKLDEALPLIPGVVRSPTGEISIAGASEQQSALLLNGLNAADPASGNFRLNLPIDAVESVQVFQHPYTAEYGAFTGGVTTIQTRRGGEDWHWEFNDFLPDLRFIGGKIVGIAEDTPRLTFNGPLIKNRLVVAQSLAYSIAKQPVRGLTFPKNETKSESQSSFTQFDATLSGRHTLTFTIGYLPQRDQFVNLDFFRPQIATPNYKQKDFVFGARDNFQFKAGLLLSAFSLKRFHANVWGQGSADQILTPTAEGGNYFAQQARRAQRVEVLEVFTLPARKLFGLTQEIKVGVDLNSVTARFDYAAHPVNILRGDGTLAERIVFHGVHTIQAQNREYVGFVQDRLLLRSNLNFDVGLRYENQQIADQTILAPRAGFAWSPRKNDRTVLRGGIGLFYDKVPLNIRSFGRFPSRTVTRYGLDGISVLDSHHFVNVLVDTFPITPLDFRRRAQTGTGFVPDNLRWNLQLDQTVSRWLSIRGNLTTSRSDHIYIVNPELDFRGRSGIVLRSAGQATYRAAELTALFRLPNKDQFVISYVRSRARGDLNDFNSHFGDFGAPVIRPNQYSNLPFDVPNRLLAWGPFSLPHRVTIAPIFEMRTGFPYSVRDAEQNFIGERNSDRTRFPMFMSLDAEFSKDFQVTKKYGIRLSLRGFNLTNHLNPRNVRANTADPSFGKFLSPYHRYFSGGFDVLF